MHTIIINVLLLLDSIFTQYEYQLSFSDYTTMEVGHPKTLAIQLKQ